jgi:hypothetical protein
MITWTESGVVNEWIGPAVKKTELDTTRAMLARLLQKKFTGPLPPEDLQAVYDDRAVKNLESWFDEAVKAATVDDFLAALRRDRHGPEGSSTPQKPR